MSEVRARSDRDAAERRLEASRRRYDLKRVVTEAVDTPALSIECRVAVTHSASTATCVFCCGRAGGRVGGRKGWGREREKAKEREREISGSK